MNKFQKILLIAYTTCIMIQCIWVPHSIMAVTISSQNVPHYTVVDKVYNFIWYNTHSYSTFSKNRVLTRTSSVDYKQLFFQLFVTTFLYIIIYLIKSKRKNMIAGEQLTLFD